MKVRERVIAIEALQRHMPDDTALVDAALCGGPEDFTPIIARYKDAVFGIALARLRHFHDAEDITQQVFIEAYERLDNLKDPLRLGAWLRTIAIHRSINHLKRERRGADLESALPAHSVATPEDDLEGNELRKQVLAAIGRLSKTQRETVTLYYISGYTQQEVAAIQEVALGTIKYRLHEARGRLKKDMVEMVEEVLKEGAPREDLAERVFSLLCAYPEGGRMWRPSVMDQIKKAGPSGEAGFAKALELPHWQTRRAAVHYLGVHFFYDGGALPLEKCVQLLKKALSDTNLKVRQWAMYGLIWGLDVDHEHRAKEFVPLIVPLLFDPSKRIRRQVARLLCRPNRVKAVSFEQAIQALAVEEDVETIRYLQLLVQNLLSIRAGQEPTRLAVKGART